LTNIAGIFLLLLFFGIGTFKLLQDEVAQEDLVKESGKITAVECRSGSRDGSPNIDLTNNGVSKTYSVLEEFSRVTKCSNSAQDLIGLPAEVFVQPNQENYSIVYELKIDGLEIYIFDDAISSDKETMYMLFFAGFLTLILWIMKIRENT
jgi:hypothetical protein